MIVKGDMNIMKLADFPVLLEIKETYVKCRNSGYSRDDAVAQLQSAYEAEITCGAEDDAMLFWIGLADAQDFLKELSADIAMRGMVAIDAIEQSDLEVDPRELRRRRAGYALAPMPERTRLGKSQKFRCSWNIGDTFAHQLSGPEAKDCGLEGRYILIRKVDEFEFGDGKLYPVVTFTMWDHTPLPQNAEEFQRLPAMKLICGRLGLPKSLYEYRAEIIVSSKRKLNAFPLVFLGNFQKVTMPPDEVTIPHPGAVMMVPLDRFDWHCCNFWKFNTERTAEDL